MTAHHAVMFVDHHRAKIFPFGNEPAQTVHEHLHLTRQHASALRAKHEFLAKVCDALKGLKEVLVTGGHTGLADFKRYVEKHRPETTLKIVAYEVVNRPTDNELMAMARKRFKQVDQMLGRPGPASQGDWA